MTKRAFTMGVLALGAAAALALAPARAAAEDEWAFYGHDAGGQRFSPLTRIDRANVAGLKLAWTFHTGDLADGHDGPRSGLETTPLFIDGRLYVTTAFNRIIALDPATGRSLWTYDPKIDRRARYGDGLINRGVAAWRDPARRHGPCAPPLFEPTTTTPSITAGGEVMW